MSERRRRRPLAVALAGPAPAPRSARPRRDDGPAAPLERVDLRGGGAARASSATPPSARPRRRSCAPQALLDQAQVRVPPDALRRRRHDRSSTTPAGSTATSPSPAPSTAFNATAVVPGPRRRALGARRTRPPTRSASRASPRRRRAARSRSPPPQAYLAVIAARAPARDRGAQPRHGAAPSTSTRARASRRARAAGSTTCARPRSWPQPKGSSRSRSWPCARPRKRSASRSSPTAPWTRAASRRSSPAAAPADDEAWLMQRPGRPPVHRRRCRPPTAWSATPGSRGCPTATACVHPAVRHARRASSSRRRPGAPFFQLQVPIYDGTLGATKRVRIADRETARLRLDAVKARGALRGPLRPGGGRRATSRSWPPAAQAAESAAEALRITEIAYRAGATTNIEVVQAQQTARNAELAAALAEDRLRQARLDLLVALGQFP